MRFGVQRWWRLAPAVVLIAAAGLGARAQAPPEPEPTPPEPPAPTTPAPTPTPAPPEPAPSEAAASESAPVDDRLGHWNLDLEQWIAEPNGLDYVAVVVANPSNPGLSQQFGPSHGTNGNLRIQLGFALRDEKGRFSLKYWSHDDEAFYSQYDPGTFALGEHLAPPQFAGVFDDGSADAVDADAQTKVRDFRLDYSRLAFTNRHVTGRWSLGLREVDHSRAFGAAYYGLIAGLPAVVGREDLNPLPDRANTVSQFSGRGPNFGFDVEIPMGKRFRFAAGVSTAVLRGDLSSGYSSVSRIYAVLPPGSQDISQILGSDLVNYLTEWAQLPPDPAPPQVLQLSIPAGVINYSRSTGAQVLEGALSVRYRAWRGLEIFAGARSTRYDNVGLEVRPTLNNASLVGQSTTTVAGIEGTSVTVPVVGVVESARSVVYEGLFVGLGYTY
ncbi:MAG TPA: hypothetical protein VFO11_06855 [Candidatus Polarisedimenticolaceae bacterium]|nr:hypothetical protein [Candidatus Polarisedimenticolaceae bacterium]